MFCRQQPLLTCRVTPTRSSAGPSHNPRRRQPIAPRHHGNSSVDFDTDLVSSSLALSCSAIFGQRSTAAWASLPRYRGTGPSVMIGYPQSSSVITSGKSSTQVPRPSHAIRSMCNTSCDFTTAPPWEGRATPVADWPNSVLPSVLTPRDQRRPGPSEYGGQRHRGGHMLPALDLVNPPRQVVESNLHAHRQEFELLGDRREPELAGSALAGGLRRKIADESRRLEHAAPGRRKGHDQAGPESHPEPARAERSGQRRRCRYPPAEVPADQERLDRHARAAGQLEHVGRPGADRHLEDPGTDH